MADDAKDEPTEEGAEDGGGGKKKLIIIIALAVVLLGGIGAGAYFFFAGGDPDEEVVEEVGPQEALYIPLEPQFVINYDVAGRDRFMQVYVTIMTRDPAVQDAVDLHNPLIRNNLVAAMGDLEFESLRAPEGKEQLRETVKRSINAVLMQETGAEGVESILFTNLVMQ